MISGLPHLLLETTEIPSHAGAFIRALSSQALVLGIPPRQLHVVEDAIYISLRPWPPGGGCISKH